jgi:hypothetical protein
MNRSVVLKEVFNGEAFIHKLVAFYQLCKVGRIRVECVLRSEVRSRKVKGA